MSAGPHAESAEMAAEYLCDRVGGQDGIRRPATSQKRLNKQRLSKQFLFKQRWRGGSSARLTAASPVVYLTGIVAPDRPTLQRADDDHAQVVRSQRRTAGLWAVCETLR
jgi:hypothetical protein